MKSSEVRKAFLSYFAERGHVQVPSLPLVPAGDPTLLFTSAGMVQFKPYFMGLAEAPAKRMSSIQKVFRATDLDEVGDTTHLTFFEMMGNFSVGDYFKAEAIAWAWDFLTNVLSLPPEKLWATIYLDDEVAHDNWRKQGVPEERIIRYGEDQNYWFSGDVGPCGPDSEIFYDYGPQDDCPSCEPAHDGHRRFVEIWNLVFMMLYQHEDGSRSELPTKNIDTGSGLERMSMVLQGTQDAYATDLFRPSIERLEALTGRRYGDDPAVVRAFRIVAEHSRALTFLVADGVAPSNEGRGYVLRRVLRRAVYFGRGLGLTGPFVSELAATVIGQMSDVHPELQHQRTAIIRLIRDEEERFSETLRRGIEILEQTMDATSGKTISGDDAFRLYDTYGLPRELTREIASEKDFAVDDAGFDTAMEAQRERARASQRFTVDEMDAELAGALAAQKSEFVGYEAMEAETTIVALVKDRRSATTVSEGDACGVVLAITPFYPEGGGQVGDSGEIATPDGIVAVEDTQTVGEGAIVHYGRIVRGEVRVGDSATATVDAGRRAATMRNHTATHLVHAALREVLGTHVRQTGSLVAPDRLRFDFSHNSQVSPEELRLVERLVNAKVRQDVGVSTRQTSYQEAINEGVIAFFGDKYGAEVRVVEVPNGVAFASAELCGGTHCHHTGQVGLFVITSEGSVGSGTRRIEALTGEWAEEWAAAQRSRLHELTAIVGGGPAEVVERVRSLAGEVDQQRRRLARLERDQARGSLQGIMQGAEAVNGSSFLTARVEAANSEGMRELADGLREQIGSGIVVLGALLDGKPAFLAMVTSDLTGRGVHAGEIVKQVAAVAGGGGGGRPELAQAGGRDASKLDEALELAGELARKSLTSPPGASRVASEDLSVNKEGGNG
ncbi:MAG: alanine--tRNA ligase [Dehalococcoidia bacterium]